MRVRVLIDVRNPLKTHVNLRLREGEVCKVQVRYENLPNICFNCGRLGHGMRDCVDALIDSKKLRYGIWLRASPWRSVKDFDQEVNREMGSTSTIAKKLFVTKDRDVKEKQGAEAVNDVASLLNKVSFEEPVEGQLGLGEVQERGMMSKGGEEAQVVQQSSPGITTEMERSNIQVADAFVFGGIESLHTPGRS